MIDEKLEGVFTDVVRRNPNQPEFQQAVRDVLESIGPVITKQPELADAKIIQRICEPERRSSSGSPGRTITVRST